MTKYIRNENTVSGRLYEEIVMMDMDKGKYFSLNPVATSIWDFLEKPLTLDALCEKLMNEYDVPAEQCKTETGAHLKEMMKLDLIKEA